jgi:hypothetical protein
MQRSASCCSGAAGLDRAISLGWLKLHESGADVN